MHAVMQATDQGIQWGWCMCPDPTFVTCAEMTQGSLYGPNGGSKGTT